MQNQKRESAFARFYIWSTAAKSIMGLFFLFFVFMYLLMGLVSSGPPVELDFFTALEMAFAAFFAGVLQYILVPGGDKLTHSRSLAWVLSSTLVTLVFSLVFRWFEAFPLWCPITFFTLTATGVAMMVEYYRLKLARETRRLNEQLEQFQKRKRTR